MNRDPSRIPAHLPPTVEPERHLRRSDHFRVECSSQRKENVGIHHQEVL